LFLNAEWVTPTSEADRDDATSAAIDDAMQSWNDYFVPINSWEAHPMPSKKKVTRKKKATRKSKTKSKTMSLKLTAEQKRKIKAKTSRSVGSLKLTERDLVRRTSDAPYD
jgi:hypothetical protein